jgi:hypothetical protein
MQYLKNLRDFIKFLEPHCNSSNKLRLSKHFVKR